MKRYSIIKIILFLAFGFSLTPALAFAATNPAAANSGISNGISRNWSGYVATSGVFTGVSGSWVVPSVTTSTNAEADATWVGIGGVASHDLIQTGTQAITQHGATTYEAWYEILPNVSQTVSMQVSAGDSISASISPSGTNLWQISIRDNTSGQNFSTTVSYDSSLSSAEWIQEMPSDQYGFIPLDTFSAIPFTNASATVNGQTMTPAQADASQLTMVTSNGSQTLATPSTLGADGASFTVSRSSTPVTTTTTRQVQSDGRGGFRRGGGGVSNYAPRVTTTGTTTTISIRVPMGFFRSAQFRQMFQIIRR